MLDDPRKIVRVTSEKEEIEFLVRLDTRVEKIESTVKAMISKMDLEHDLHHEYIKRALEREDRRAKLHQAIIEKTLSSLVWSTLVGIAWLVWNSVKDHWKG